MIFFLLFASEDMTSTFLSWLGSHEIYNSNGWYMGISIVKSFNETVSSFLYDLC